MNKSIVQFFCSALFLFMLLPACRDASSTNAAVQKESAEADPLRFEKDIKAIQQISFDRSRDRVVFTGSSSVRLWENLQENFPAHQIINTGFGGSEMSDLSYYLQETVLRFAPTKVFIYEGDNDINSGRSTAQMLSHAEHIISMIHQQLPACKIYFISPKPSPARWHLRSSYEEFNNTLTKTLTKYPNCTFIDIWPLMLDGNKEVRKDLFVEDQLHLNAAGYEIWDGVMRGFVEGE